MDSNKINKINVLGWFGHGNVGDESYKLAIPEHFSESNCKFIFSDKPIYDCHSYILGGGDTVSDYFLDSLAEINKPKHLLSVTIREKTDPRKLKQFSSIYVRDFESMSWLSRNGIASKYAPDFAFRLKSNPTRGKELIKSRFKEESKDLYTTVIGIVINSNLCPVHDTLSRDHARFEKFVYDISNSVDHTSASFIFIPFGKEIPWDDRISNGLVASKTKFYKKNLVIMDKIDVQETLDIISSVDMMISSRLHSSIFSCLNAIPFIDIVHNHKNKYLLKSLGLEDFGMTYVNFSEIILAEKIDFILKNKLTIKTKLQTISKEQLNLIEKVPKNVDQL